MTLCGLAINYLADNYSALSGDGVLYTDVFSIMDYLTEHEKKLYEEKWARLEAKLPEKYRSDLIREMKLLNSLRTHESAKWLGSLYDPETGGWYISRSARETEALFTQTVLGHLLHFHPRLRAASMNSSVSKEETISSSAGGTGEAEYTAL